MKFALTELGESMIDKWFLFDKKWYELKAFKFERRCDQLKPVQVVTARPADSCPTRWESKKRIFHFPIGLLFKTHHHLPF